MDKIEKIEEDIKKLNEKLEQAKKQQKLECLSCHKKTEICKLDLVVSKYYVSPSGCMDGDYWTEGNHPDFYITCPKCKQKNRYYYSEYWKDTKLQSELALFIEKNRYSFKNNYTTFDSGETWETEDDRSDYEIPY